MSEIISLKRKIIYISIPYLVITGILLSVEGMIRMKYNAVSKLALFTSGNFERKVEVLSGHDSKVFDGDVVLGWKLMDNLKNAHWDFTTFSTNKQGIRYYKNISPKKLGEVRIISLGDSVTFGYRVPVAFPKEPLNYDRSQMTYTQLIETRLRNNNQGKEVEVIPMAVPGYTSYQGFLWLKRDIEFLKPDLITILFGWNDTEMHEKSDFEALPDNWLRHIQRYTFSKSQALVRFSSWFNKEKERGQKQQVENSGRLIPRVSREEFISNILAINELAKKNNSKVLIIGTVLRDVISDPDQSNRIVSYRRELARVAQETNIDYLEIPVLTEADYPDNNSLFGELIHPNSAGHQIMAEKIYDVIRDRQLVGGLGVKF